MIYYNLDSDYPGDITKHCGLTIDEVDNNFYELERMIREITPSICSFEQRFWVFSGNKEGFPSINTVNIQMVNENTCNISGVVTDGKLSIGIDNINMFGVSPVLYGKVFANETRLPNNTLLTDGLISNSSLSITALVEELPSGELGLNIYRGNGITGTVYIETVNRRLNLEFEYGGEIMVSGNFVFDENIIIENPNPSVWVDTYVWKDSYVWTTRVNY